MAVILIGFMAAGKSTVAKALDKENFVDLDKEIEKEVGMTIAQFFQEYGEDKFRKIEREKLEAAILSGFNVATGGGIVNLIENRNCLKKLGNVVYLKADFETLYERILLDKENSRPLAFQSKEEVKKLFAQRVKFYEEVADIVIETRGKGPEEVVKEIQELK
ncbi:MAG TPA: shikimate kinase [Lactococcus sp.]|uniref:shikimate kinase n=1 Tax=Lactococcus TaxID=1357 RepID=UPI000E8DC1F1|nr:MULTISPECIES: shikimate kinase [Lactococcus]HBC89927.1 shikimate kinase [Lactococcus sp.]